MGFAAFSHPHFAFAALHNVSPQHWITVVLKLIWDLLKCCILYMSVCSFGCCKNNYARSSFCSIIFTMRWKIVSVYTITIDYTFSYGICTFHRQIKFIQHFDGIREKTTAHCIDVNEAKRRIRITDEEQNNGTEIQRAEEEKEKRKQIILM